MIQTVKGPLMPEKLGITMSHEHLALNLSRIRKEDDSDFSCEQVIIEEIRQMMEYGVRSVVEVTCNDMGRDVRQLVRISDACNLNIICATGYYLSPYHPDYVVHGEIEEITDLICHDILEGIDGTGVRAGVIGEVASSKDEIMPSEKKVLQAAARASVLTGFAVTTHCQLGTMALEQSALLQKEGMNPDNIVLGHIDLADDRDYHLEILKTGVNIGFDTIGKISYLSDERRADNLMWLVEKGYEDHIVLSQDISRKSYFARNGQYSGYMTVMKDFVPLLKRRGIKEKTLCKLLAYNPARIFDVRE
jgi:phosphotriesterase-related protein